VSAAMRRWATPYLCRSPVHRADVAHGQGLAHVAPLPDRGVDPLATPPLPVAGGHCGLLLNGHGSGAPFQIKARVAGAGNTRPGRL
jgi:hypothetical protein